jgi:transcriptional regulator NrdR family protein
VSRQRAGVCCPYCGHQDSRVIDSPLPRRRRVCAGCGRRFSTIETPTPLVAVTTPDESATISATPAEKSSVEAEKTGVT